MATILRAPIICRKVRPRFVQSRDESLNLLVTTLAGQDLFFGAAGQPPQYELPRTKLIRPVFQTQPATPLNIDLIGQDLFFGAAGQPPQYELPAKRTYRRIFQHQEKLPLNLNLVFGFATVTLTGTITAATVESDIVTGGKTIVLTVAGDTWVSAGATFDAERQNIINGMTSAQSELLGWNNVVKALQGVAGVVRTSDAIVTITLDAQATYNITATETITVTIPSTALVLAVSVVAAPTFTVSLAGATGVSAIGSSSIAHSNIGRSLIAA